MAWLLEDFGTYTEEDDNTKLTVTTNKAEAADADRDEDVWLYKDKTLNYFDALDEEFEIYIAATSEVSCMGGMAICNSIGSMDDITDGVSIDAYNYTGSFRMYIRRDWNVADDFAAISSNTPYYCTLVRAAGNNTITLNIYSDSARENLVDNPGVAGFGTAKFRYIYGFINNNSGHADRNFDGYVQNLNLKDAQAHTKALSDTIAISDAVTTKAIGVFKADTVNITDSFSKVSEFKRSISDTVNIGDAIAHSIGLFKSETAMAITDSIAKAISLAKSESALSISDSISKAVGLIKGDTIAITDICSPSLKAFKRLKDFTGRALGTIIGRDLSDDNDEFRDLK